MCDGECTVLPLYPSERALCFRTKTFCHLTLWVGRLKERVSNLPYAQMIPRPSFASLFAAPAQRRIQGLTSFPKTLSRLSISRPCCPVNPLLSRGVRSYPRSRAKPDSSFGSGFTDAVNRLPSTAVVIGIIVVNGAVFMMWQGAKGEAVSRLNYCGVPLT